MIRIGSKSYLRSKWAEALASSTVTFLLVYTRKKNNAYLENEAFLEYGHGDKYVCFDRFNQNYSWTGKIWPNLCDLWALISQQPLNLFWSNKSHSTKTGLNVDLNQSHWLIFNRKSSILNIQTYLKIMLFTYKF